MSKSAMLAATLSSCAGESTSPRDQQKPAWRGGNSPAGRGGGGGAVLVGARRRPADMQRSRRGPVAVLDDTELGGAAADVDVKDTPALIVRQLRCARAIGRQHRFHVVPGGGG